MSEWDQLIRRYWHHMGESYASIDRAEQARHYRDEIARLKCALITDAIITSSEGRDVSKLLRIVKRTLLTQAQIDGSL